jgi:hypothetical protein
MVLPRQIMESFVAMNTIDPRPKDRGGT